MKQQLVQTQTPAEEESEHHAADILKDKEQQLLQREKEIEELRQKLEQQVAAPAIVIQSDENKAEILAHKEQLLKEKEALLEEQKRQMEEKAPQIELVAQQLEALKSEVSLPYFFMGGGRLNNKLLCRIKMLSINLLPKKKNLRN